MSDNYEKAVEMAQKVVEIEPDNVHGWCNLALYHHSVGNQVAVQSVVRVLAQLNLISLSEITRWGLTMGTLGRHRRVYNRLLEAYYDGEYNTEVLHMLAVACVNLHKWKEAHQYWAEILDYENHSAVVEFYLSVLEDDELASHLPKRIDYIYQLPIVSLLRDLLREQEQGDEKADETLAEWRKSPIVRYLADWLLIRDESELKLAGLRLLGWLGDDVAHCALRGFIAGDYENDALKLQALVELQRNANVDGTKARLTSGSLTLREAPLTNQLLEEVESHLTDGAHECGLDTDETSIAALLWQTFVDKQEKEIRVVKATVWAAGTHYVFNKLFGVPNNTYAQLARDYDVSPASVKRTAQIIEEVILD